MSYCTGKNIEIARGKAIKIKNAGYREKTSRGSSGSFWGT